MITAVLLSIATIINGQDMDLNIINSFLFHPRKSFQKMDEKDMLIEVAKDVKIGVRFHLIDKSFPTLLFFFSDISFATNQLRTK